MRLLLFFKECVHMLRNWILGLTETSFMVVSDISVSLLYYNRVYIAGYESFQLYDFSLRIKYNGVSDSFNDKVSSAVALSFLPVTPTPPHELPTRTELLFCITCFFAGNQREWNYNCSISLCDR